MFELNENLVLPEGPFFLESFIVLFPNINYINYNNQDLTLTLEFVSTKGEDNPVNLKAEAEMLKALRIFHRLNMSVPRVFQLTLLSEPYLNKLIFRRDISTLTPEEVNCLSDLFEQYFPLADSYDLDSEQNSWAFRAHDDIFFQHDDFDFFHNFKSMSLSRDKLFLQFDQFIKSFISGSLKKSK